MLELLLNEDLWFPTATALALATVATWAFRQRRTSLSGRVRIVSGMNLFYGVLIGIMGSGHLFGVTLKTVLGTLPTSTNAWFVFPLGFALALPAWWLVAIVPGLVRNEQPVKLTALTLNVWLGAVLVPFGWPLAVPAALNAFLLVWNRAA